MMMVMMVMVMVMNGSASDQRYRRISHGSTILPAFNQATPWPLLRPKRGSRVSQKLRAKGFRSNTP